MRDGYKKIAKKGHHFVMTEKGLQRTLLKGTEKAKAERRVGQPIKGYETSAPVSWIENGWIREVRQ